MPLQSDIAKSIFMGLSRTGPIEVGAFAMSSGLRQSARLDAFLRTHFGATERADDSLMHVWLELQARGETLETLYAQLLAKSTGDDAWIVREFEAIVRTLISEKVNRGVDGVCDYHRALIRKLEPGDVIVNFNWDTLASDALYHFSKLWFPVTGFGPSVGVVPKHVTDILSEQSLVTVLQVHGGVCLYVPIDKHGNETQVAVYVPPETYDPGSSMLDTLRIPEYDHPGGGAMRDPSEEKKTRFDAGWIHIHEGVLSKAPSGRSRPPSSSCSLSHKRGWSRRPECLCESGSCLRLELVLGRGRLPRQ
jgi:hypothetical protein